MREPEIKGEEVDFGMVQYYAIGGLIGFCDGDAPYEPHEWDDLLDQLKAAIRYARKVAK